MEDLSSDSKIAQLRRQTPSAHSLPVSYRPTSLSLVLNFPPFTHSTGAQKQLTEIAPGLKRHMMVPWYFLNFQQFSDAS